MDKNKLKNIGELLKNATELMGIYGASFTIGEIVRFLNDEEKNKDKIIASDFDELRDYLVGKLIKSLIKYKIIEKTEPTVLGDLTKIDLKDALEKYLDFTNHVDFDYLFTECNTAYLFDPYGGDAFDLLEIIINETIDKWGVNKDIKDFYRYNKKLSISDVKLRWVYKRFIDDYDTENESGSVMDLLKNQYDTDILERLTVKEIYDFAETPHDFTENNEIHYEDVERVSSFSPTEKEFFLLIWKYYAEEYKS